MSNAHKRSLLESVAALANCGSAIIKFLLGLIMLIHHIL